eukprot:TRINITY_DN9561_c0_g1_i1.p1 TRINITY_DN9561_c0_g1~~TRINITY_DN9561_c0_g1_i1.p1  ORF type:complete len:822 (+),score=132.05 TRINITY_DN9561_c0_g1_i1:521-2986(+)
MAKKVTEPGVVNNMDSRLNLTMCGTPSYLAPEMVTQDHHSLAADVFSLGSLAYFMLAGKAPFDVASQDPVADTLKQVSEVKYSLPEHLSASAKTFLTATLQKDPIQRPSVQQLSQHPFILGNRSTPSPVASTSWSNGSVARSLSGHAATATVATSNTAIPWVYDHPKINTSLPSSLHTASSLSDPSLSRLSNPAEFPLRMNGSARNEGNSIATSTGATASSHPSVSQSANASTHGALHSGQQSRMDTDFGSSHRMLNQARGSTTSSTHETQPSLPIHSLPSQPQPSVTPATTHVSTTHAPASTAAAQQHLGSTTQTQRAATEHVPYTQSKAFIPDGPPSDLVDNRLSPVVAVLSSSMDDPIHSSRHDPDAAPSLPDTSNRLLTSTLRSSADNTTYHSNNHASSIASHTNVLTALAQTSPARHSEPKPSQDLPFHEPPSNDPTVARSNGPLNHSNRAPHSLPANGHAQHLPPQPSSPLSLSQISRADSSLLLRRATRRQPPLLNVKRLRPFIHQWKHFKIELTVEGEVSMVGNGQHLQVAAGGRTLTTDVGTPSQRSYTSSLPERVSASLAVLRKIVEVVRSKTPKVTYYSPNGKCMLMENAAKDVDMRYYNSSARVLFQSDKIKVTTSEGTCVVLGRHDQLASALQEIQRQLNSQQCQQVLQLVEHAWVCAALCRSVEQQQEQALELAANHTEHDPLIDVFPLRLGAKPPGVARTRHGSMLHMHAEPTVPSDILHHAQYFTATQGWCWLASNGDVIHTSPSGELLQAVKDGSRLRVYKVTAANTLDMQQTIELPSDTVPQRLHDRLREMTDFVTHINDRDA